MIHCRAPSPDYQIVPLVDVFALRCPSEKFTLGVGSFEFRPEDQLACIQTSERPTRQRTQSIAGNESVSLRFLRLNAVSCRRSLTLVACCRLFARTVHELGSRSSVSSLLNL